MKSFYTILLLSLFASPVIHLQAAEKHFSSPEAGRFSVRTNPAIEEKNTGTGQSQLSATDGNPQDSSSIGAIVFNKEKIRLLPVRNIHGLALTHAGVWYLKYDRLFSDGLESGAGNYIIEGMQVSDANGFPLRAVGGFKMHRTSVPASVINTNGSVIELSVMDYGEDFHVELDAYTSLKNGLGINNLEFNAGLPLRSNKQNTSQPVPRLFISSALHYTDDPHPGWETKYTMKQDKLSDIRQNPLEDYGNAFHQSGFRSEYLSSSDLEQIKAHKHANRTSFNNFVKLTVPVSRNIELSAGSYLNYNTGREFIFENMLMNSHNNPSSTYLNLDNFLNFNHTINISDELTISYRLHLQSSNYNYRKEHEEFGADFFKYAYVGSFTNHMVRSYEEGSDDVTGFSGMIQNAFFDTLVEFRPSTINPGLANYTQQYFEMRGGNVRNYFEIIPVQGGLINGSNPQTIYELWNNVGAVSPYYVQSESQKYRRAFNIDINYKAHTFSAGMVYMNEIKSQYSLNTNSLWPLMRGMTNYHLNALDFSNPIPVYDNIIYQDTVNYMRSYDMGSQYEFDKNLRRKLGLPVDGLDYILIDSYDMVNNTIQYYDQNQVLHTLHVTADLFNIADFSAAELIDMGGAAIHFMGYDHTGQRLASKNDDYAFFNDFTINAYRPKTLDFFIGDSFKWKNLDVSASLHFSRFDANQPVLKDAYSLYEIKTSSEVDELGGNAVSHPSNIGSDYVVYVDNPLNPTMITGYRNGHTWYDHSGAESQYVPGSNYALLMHPGKWIGSSDWTPDISFQSYKPHTSLLPRVHINLHTPVGDIYAYYNSFSINPDSYNYFLPAQYLYFERTSFKTNPALIPTQINKTGAGFKSMITKWLLADVSYQGMFIRNQQYGDFILGAYPNSYYTISNYDSLVPVYHINLGLEIMSGKPAGLEAGCYFTRSFVQEKHQLMLNIPEMLINSWLTYQFGRGGDFTLNTGSSLRSILEGVGAGLNFHYRKGLQLEKPERVQQLYFYSPSIYLFNARIEKAVYIKAINLNAKLYLLVENLFNARNLFYIDPLTGKADDDGYLSKPENQNIINSKQNPATFRLLYKNSLQNPGYYDRPRILFVGINISI
jgi:hypothetical protein